MHHDGLKYMAKIKNRFYFSFSNFLNFLFSKEIIKTRDLICIPPGASRQGCEGATIVNISIRGGPMEAEDLAISGEENLVITEDDEGLGDAQAPSAKIGGSASPPPDADGAVANDDKFDARTLMSLYTTLQSELAATRRQVIDLETALQQKQAALVAREAAFEKQSQLIADLSSDIGQLKAAKQTKKQIKKDVAKDVNELKLSLALVESENRRLRGIGDEVQNVKREWKAIHDAQQKELNRVRCLPSLASPELSTRLVCRTLTLVVLRQMATRMEELARVHASSDEGSPCSPCVCVCVCVVRGAPCAVRCVVRRDVDPGLSQILQSGSQGEEDGERRKKWRNTKKK
jgi:hypothetical protein